MSNRGIAEIIGLFAFVLGLGFWIALAVISSAKVALISNSLNSAQFTFLAYILDAGVFGTLILMVLRRHHSRTSFFRILEFLVITFTSFFAFMIVGVLLLSQYLAIGYIYTIAGCCALLLIAMKELHPKARDAATMTSSIGIGVLLGLSLSFVYAMAALAIMAVYDYVTIIRTKAMVKFDKELIANNIAFLISVSDVESLPFGYFGKKEEDKYEQYLIKTHLADDPKFRAVIKKGRLPILSQVSLGEGDLSLPLMVAVSAYYSAYGQHFAWALTGMVAIGALIGVIATMLLLKRYKKPLPALPPLFAFISIGAGCAYLLAGIGPLYVPAAFIAVSVVLLISMLAALARKARSSSASARAQKHESKRPDGKRA